MSVRGDKKITGRRAVLASVAAAGATCSLPSRWKRPVVDSVLLPAHAQTSVQPTSAILTTLGALSCDADFTFSISALNAVTGSTGALVTYQLSLEFFATCSDPHGASTSTLVSTDSFTDNTTFSDTAFPSFFTTSGTTGGFTVTGTFTTTATV